MEPSSHFTDWPFGATDAPRNNPLVAPLETATRRMKEFSSTFLLGLELWIKYFYSVIVNGRHESADASADPLSLVKVCGDFGNLQSWLSITQPFFTFHCIKCSYKKGKKMKKKRKNGIFSYSASSMPKNYELRNKFHRRHRPRNRYTHQERA